MNAFAHRVWYEPGGYVQVEIYSDAVEITSPGWFISGQDPVAPLEGRSTSARTRNELLTHALFRSGDIESYGMGMRTIKRLCDEAGIGVEYRDEGFGTKVVFHRRDAFGVALVDGGSDKVAADSDKRPVDSDKSPMGSDKGPTGSDKRASSSDNGGRGTASHVLVPITPRLCCATCPTGAPCAPPRSRVF